MRLGTKCFPTPGLIELFYGGPTNIHSATKTEKVITCSRLRLNTSKLVFAVKMTLAVGMA